MNVPILYILGDIPLNRKSYLIGLLFFIHGNIPFLIQMVFSLTIYHFVKIRNSQ